MPKTVSSALPSLPCFVYQNIYQIKGSDYKKIEIQAIRLEKDGDKFIARIVTSNDPGPIEMFSVYLRNNNGAAECIADFATGPEAVAYANLLNGSFGWEIGGRAMHQYVLRSNNERGFWKNNFGWYTDPKDATLFDSEIDVISQIIMANADVVRLIDQTAFELDSESRESSRMGSQLKWRVLEQADGSHGIESPAGMVALVRDIHDARFIAKAANTHSTLVEAIEDAVEWLATGKVSGVGFDQLAMIDNFKAVLKQVA